MSALAQSAVQRLRAEGLRAVIRAGTAEHAVHAGRALAAGGVRALEVAFTTPDAEQAIAALASSGDLFVGAGTVLTPAQAEAAIDAGAQFLVSPGFLEPVLDVAEKAGVLALPGALTPTEVLAAAARAEVVKLFPASLGGPAYLRALLAPLPEAKLVPTGGVSVTNLGDWLGAGAFALGAGADLCPPGAIAAEDFASLTESAQRYRTALDRTREARAREERA
jgi:2-dehydro-3-deoxyphosphogluconate aldolase/(4S)-4-hydroxy-2-oxoglutarate aldolase